MHGHLNGQVTIDQFFGKGPKQGWPPMNADSKRIAYPR
jgi:hypothetical protein